MKTLLSLSYLFVFSIAGFCQTDNGKSIDLNVEFISEFPPGTSVMAQADVTTLQMIYFEPISDDFNVTFENTPFVYCVDNMPVLTLEITPFIQYNSGTISLTLENKDLTFDNSISTIELTPGEFKPVPSWSTIKTPRVNILYNQGNYNLLNYNYSNTRTWYYDYSHYLQSYSEHKSTC